MNTLFQKVILVDPGATHHLKIRDVLVDATGIIAAIADEVPSSQLPADTKIVSGNGKACLSIGWFDMRVSFREPGEEQKETIRSGQQAAANGGFTGVLLMPSTKPALQSRADMESVKSRAAGFPVDVFPAGVVTLNREGKELAEMHDMSLGGALAFTDDKRVIGDSGVMLRAFQYARNNKRKVITFADDPGISGKLVTHESATTTLLGFKGSPAIAEAISLNRDIALAAYAGQPLHVSGISSKEAVDVIRKAKGQGMDVTAEVAVHHLLLTDASLEQFDSHFKVKPPLRGEEDRSALKEALLDGTIDVVVSDHAPEDLESKQVEFDFAAFGMIGLESAYGVLSEAMGKLLTPEKTVQWLAIQPRKILGLDVPQMKVGSKANLTYFDPECKWVFQRESIKSLSANSPFIGKTFTGKALAIYNQGQLIMS